MIEDFLDDMRHDADPGHAGGDRTADVVDDERRDGSLPFNSVITSSRSRLARDQLDGVLPTLKTRSETRGCALMMAAT